MNNIVKYALILLLLLFMQIAFFNHIIIGYGIIVFVYILFILVLPVKTPGWTILLIAFFSGLAIDSVFNSGGIHSFSTVLVAFLRPLILRFVSNPYDLELAFRPGMKSLGFLNFVKYSVILVFVHNFMVLYLEAFSFSGFLLNFLIVLINTALTVLVCLLLEAMFRKEKIRH
jgi:rod shape-determining protein MreD